MKQLHHLAPERRQIALLRKYRVALVCADTVEWPLLMDVTSDFIYCRLHGSEQLYASGYAAKAIAKRLPSAGGTARTKTR